MTFWCTVPSQKRTPSTWPWFWEFCRSTVLFVKLSKCSFGSSTVEYLGHLIGDGLLKADTAKIEAMTAWPKPKNVKQLRGFLGLTGYYRRFVAHYALIAAPLTDILKKNAFAWSAATESSFGNLKKPMTSAPVLRLPDFDRPFCVETDASDIVKACRFSLGQRM